MTANVAELAVVAALTAGPVWLVMHRLVVRKWRRQGRETIVGHLLGCWLFRDRPSRVLQHLAAATIGAAKLFCATLPPIFVLALPGMAVVMWLDSRHGTEPVQPGDTVVIAVRFAPPRTPFDRPVFLDDWQLDTAITTGVVLDAPAVAIEAEGDEQPARKFWRVRIHSAGTHEVAITAMAGQWRTVIPIVAGEAQAGRAKPAAWHRPTTSVERIAVAVGMLGVVPLPADSPVDAIDLHGYRPADVTWGEWRFHWAVWYVTFTFIFVLVLPGLRD